MPDVKLGAVPFPEAIAYLKDKVDLPTRHWDDLLGEIRAKAFAVAGATKVAMVGDFRAALIKTRKAGGTLTDFRKDFDRIVKRYGWSYKGKRGWRSRVIFDNNMRSAAMAGRWQQMQRTKETRPYLEYLSVGDRRVREEHAAWHGLILPMDDPWFDTHYPPNGFGCRCTVRTLSQRQLEREGRQVGKAPALNKTERINVRTGEVYGAVPKGIGVGWDYNVGKAWIAPESVFGQRLASLPKALRDAALEQLPKFTRHLHRPYRSWAQDVLAEDYQVQNRQKVVGYLDKAVVEALEQRGMTPRNLTITLTDKALLHMARETKKTRGAAIPDAGLLTLPKHIEHSQAVLFDKTDPALLYVFDAGEAERLGKFVVRVNYNVKGKHTNSVRTGGMASVRNLKGNARYELINGKL